MTDAIKWERRDSGFDVTLLKYSVRRLIPLGYGPDVLDVGCNDGLFTKELCKVYKRVVGLDPSSVHLAKAQQYVPEAELCIDSIETYTPDRLFDSIYMLNVLEHINNPVQTLAVMRRWLKPDGCIIIQVPNALAMNRRIGLKMRLIENAYSLSTVDIKIGHKRFYDADSLKQDVFDSGLIVKDEGSIFFKPFSNSQMDYFITHCMDDAALQDKFCDACFELAGELPQYSGPIWVKCKN